MSSIYVLEDFRKQGEADFHLFQSLINDKENKEENLSEKKVDSNDLFNTGYVSSLMGLLMNLKKLSKAAQVSFGTISKETEAIVENLNNLEGRYKIVKDKVIKSCEMLENTNEFIFGNEKYPVTYPQPQQGRFNTESFPDGLYEQYLKCQEIPKIHLLDKYQSYFSTHLSPEHPSFSLGYSNPGGLYLSWKERIKKSNKKNKSSTSPSKYNIQEKLKSFRKGEVIKSSKKVKKLKKRWEMYDEFGRKVQTTEGENFMEGGEITIHDISKPVLEKDLRRNTVFIQKPENLLAKSNFTRLSLPPSSQNNSPMLAKNHLSTALSTDSLSSFVTSEMSETREVLDVEDIVIDNVASMNNQHIPLPPSIEINKTIIPPPPLLLINNSIPSPPIIGISTSNNHSHPVTNPKIPPPPIPVIKVENEVRTDIPLPPNFVVCESKIPSPPSFEGNKSNIPPPPLSTFNIPQPRSNLNIPLPPITKIKGENERGSNIPLPHSFGVSESKIPSPPLVTDSKIPPPPLLTNSNPLAPPICVGFSVFPPSTISIPSPPSTQSQIPPPPSNTFIPPPPKILPNLSSNNSNTSQTNPTFIPPPPTLVDLPPIDSSIPPPPILTKTIIPSPPELNISNNSNSFKETDLKSQILSVKLKKSTGENSQPVKPKDPRDELLSSIRAGVVLKKAAERVLTQKPKAKQAFDVFSVLQTAIKDKFKSLHSEYDEESSELDEDW